MDAFVGCARLDPHLSVELLLRGYFLEVTFANSHTPDDKCCRSAQSKWDNLVSNANEHSCRIDQCSYTRLHSFHTNGLNYQSLAARSWSLQTQILPANCHDCCRHDSLNALCHNARTISIQIAGVPTATVRMMDHTTHLTKSSHLAERTSNLTMHAMLLFQRQLRCCNSAVASPRPDVCRRTN